jgi:hypothetical protein
MEKDKQVVTKPKKSLTLDVENLRELTPAESDVIVGGTGGEPISCNGTCRRNTRTV